MRRWMLFALGAVLCFMGALVVLILMAQATLKP